MTGVTHVPHHVQSREAVFRLSVFCLLTLAYLVTAPAYHTTAIDAYYFAIVITEYDLWGASGRLFLWLASMQALYQFVAIFRPDPDPFVISTIVNAIATSLAVVLLERLLRRHFDVPPVASWMTALTFGASYGTWRYATELEVYAPAALVAVVLLSLAFSTADMHTREKSLRIFLTAFAGAVGSFFYQPLGIVAGIAIPVFFLAQRIPRDLFQYCVTYSVLLIGGFVTLALASGSNAEAPSLFDTDGKGMVWPDLTILAASVVAFLQNLLSVNWAFAFPPTRTVIDENLSVFFLQELIATDPPHWGFWIFLLTVPAAVVSLWLAFALLRRAPDRRRLTSFEWGALCYLAVHAAMVLALHPQGFEAWIPTLVPVFLLLGSRIAGPLARLGHTSTLCGIVAIFVLHNWFAGVGVFANAERDYNRILGEPALTHLDTGDLALIGADWPLAMYLGYHSRANVLLVANAETDYVLQGVEETISGGRNVMIYPDVTAPSWKDMKRAPHLQSLVGKLPAQVIAKGEKIETEITRPVLLLRGDKH